MEKSNYPFLILTDGERFPRLLVTRRPDLNDEKDSLYGAFLPATMVRRLLDFVQRVFRLHPCEFDLDGSFDAPCPEYFLHRCLAPCVAKICDDEKYQSAVAAVRALLSNRGEELLLQIDREIEVLSENLEFERAAEIRDLRRAIAEITTDSKWRIHAENFVDVVTANVADGAANIHLNTLRRGKSVGGKHFVLQTEDENADEGAALKSFIESFYRYYLPRRIYVSKDFAERKALEKDLTRRFGRKAEIRAELPEKLPPTVFATQQRAAILNAHAHLRKARDAEKIAADLQRIFNLKTAPRRVECFDVAHLAGREIVAARVVGINGKLEKDEDFVWQFENLSETESLAESLRERLKLLPSRRHLPDLIVLDGGKPQLSAARAILAEFGLPKLPLVAAVKPPQQHGKISHFLTNANAAKIIFDPRSDALNYLQKLRDAAHDLANRTHREIHSLVQIFNEHRAADAPQIQLLLVPKRYAKRGGEAEDLTPIRALSQTGEVLLKKKTARTETGEIYKRRSRFSRRSE